MSMLCIVLVAEAVYPTMGDEDHCAVFDAPSVSPMHPGYIGSKLLLESPAKMPPDGLCLYHCLVAARDYVSYMSMSVSQREALAEQLRQKSIDTLKEHNLSS